MKILLNNKTIILDDGLTIKRLLDTIDVQHKYFAVEINEEIVPKSSHRSVRIKDGDKVEICAKTKEINLLISKSEISIRNKKFKISNSKKNTGVLKKYARLVSQADTGATTH